VMSATPIEGGSSTARLAQVDTRRLRCGAVCLLGAGLAEVAGVLLRGPLTSPERSPADFVSVSSSQTLHAAWELLLPAAMLQCFGWGAVYLWRRRSADERWAFRAAVLAILALIVFLPVWGAFGLTSHEAALAEVAGQRGAVALIAATAEGVVARKFLVVSVISGLVAVGIWARVLWRVRGLSHLVPALLVLHTVTQSVTAPLLPPWGYRFECLGAVGFAAACAVLSARMWRDTQGAAT
jgi:hypothetical protein